MKTQPLFLRVTQETEDFWRAVAGYLGFISDRGPMKGSGNVSGLMEAVANAGVSKEVLSIAIENVWEAFVIGPQPSALMSGDFKEEEE